jgi:hypothetical protein
MSKLNLSKKQLIDDIRFFYLKKGIECDNIFNISKSKLLQIVIDNDIPHINHNDLKNEIEETEKFNYFTQVIQYNFHKFNNIPYNDIKILFSTNNINSSHLNDFIIKNNLQINNDMNETKILINDLFFAIDKYCKSTNKNNDITYKTIPHIINFLSKI